METILEKIIELAEKIWLRLDILLDLEGIEALDFLKPLLAGIKSDPLFLGLAITGTTIILYSIFKIKKTHAEKEKRLDALLQELDETEEKDEVDFDSPLFSTKGTEASSYDESSIDTSSEFEQKEQDNEIYGDEFESPASEEKVTTPVELDQPPQEIFKNRRISDDDFGWETSVEEWDELYDYISKPFQADKPKQEGESTTVPQKPKEVPQKSEETATASEDLNQTSQEIFKNRRISDDDFGWETSVEEWDELYDYISKPFQADKPAAVSSKEKAVAELEKESVEPVPEQEESEEVAEFLEAVAELEKESAEPTSDEEELEEVAEFLEAVSELEKKSAEPTSDEEELEEANAFLEAVSKLEEEPPETMPDEEKLDPRLSETDQTIRPKPAIDITAEPALPERIELSLEEVETEPELESDLVAKTSTSEASKSQPVMTNSSASPLLKSILNSSVSAKTDALVSRLKTFQAELENRFSSLDIEPETIKKALTTESLRKKRSKYQPAEVNYRSKRKSLSNKEYLSQLESFIFMAKQKNQKTDT